MWLVRWRPGNQGPRLNKGPHPLQRKFGNKQLRSAPPALSVCLSVCFQIGPSPPATWGV